MPPTSRPTTSRRTTRSPTLSDHAWDRSQAVEIMTGRRHLAAVQADPGAGRSPEGGPRFRILGRHLVGASDRPGRDLRPVLHAQPPQHVADVVPHRPPAHHDPRRDLGVRQPVRDQVRDLALAGRQGTARLASPAGRLDWRLRRSRRGRQADEVSDRPVQRDRALERSGCCLLVRATRSWNSRTLREYATV